LSQPSSDPVTAARALRLERLTSFNDVRVLESGRAEFRFDEKHRYLQSGRSRFETQDDLQNYLSALLPTVAHGTGIKGSMKRVGKYERVTGLGDAAFSFGDPILDLITDDHGHLHIGGRRFNLYSRELAGPDRGGGLSCVDFAPYAAKMREAHVLASMTESSPFTVLECTDKSVTIASRNPHQQWFYSGTTKMRFRAFIRSYLIYQKIGAEIETWGHDFRTASIHSRYGTFLDDHGHCFVVHSDSDSDTSDDYVDEYEWFLGARVSSGYDGVESSCVADWHGRVYSGVVESGCIVVDT
jgi:hypothetical protein